MLFGRFLLPELSNARVIILEAKLTTTEKEWYIRAVGQFGWSKSELLRQIEAEAHLTLDLPDKVCYTPVFDSLEANDRLEVL